MSDGSDDELKAQEKAIELKAAEDKARLVREHELRKEARRKAEEERRKEEVEKKRKEEEAAAEAAAAAAAKEKGKARAFPARSGSSASR